MGGIKAFNPMAEEMFGYSVEEILGHNVAVLIPFPHRERHDEYIEEYLRTGHKKVIGSIPEVDEWDRVPCQFECQ